MEAQITAPPTGTGSIFGIPGYSSCNIDSAPIIFDTDPLTETICNPTCYTSVDVPPAATTEPPNGCCYGCIIDADSVRLIYWEPDLEPPSNMTITAAPSTPYTVVSDGFTL
jgi:hypothetical protein